VKTLLPLEIGIDKRTLIFFWQLVDVDKKNVLDITKTNRMHYVCYMLYAH